jgi:hypothetical protein
MMTYTGEQPPPPAGELFKDQLVADPTSMAAALDFIATNEVSIGRVLGYFGEDTERRNKRWRALNQAWEFLGSGAMSGRFRYDRPTERVMASDKQLQDLNRRHRAAESRPNDQAEYTRRIRARQLAIYAGRLAAATRVIAPSKEAA